jgi:hypothetical protein
METKKMLFYLTTLNLVKFLTKKVPKTSENKFDLTTVMVVDTWNHINFKWKNYILNELDNKL